MHCQVPQVAGITIEEEEEEEEAGSPVVSDDESAGDESADDESADDADSVLVTDDDDYEGASDDAGEDYGAPDEADDSDIEEPAAHRAPATRQPGLQNELQVCNYVTCSLKTPAYIPDGCAGYLTCLHVMSKHYMTVATSDCHGNKVRRS